MFGLHVLSARGIAQAFMDHIEGVEQILNVGAPVDLQVGHCVSVSTSVCHMRNPTTVNAMRSETTEFISVTTHVVGPQHRQHHSDGRGVLRLAASDRHVSETRCQFEHGLSAGRAYLGGM